MSSPFEFSYFVTFSLQWNHWLPVSFPTLQFYLVIRSNEQTTNDSPLFLSLRLYRLSAFIERPMKIEIVVDPSKPLPLASRVAPAAVATNGVQTPTPRVGGRARRIRGRGGARKADRAPKSAADLDAEMEDYTASNGPAVAA